MDFNKDLELYKSIIQVNNIDISKVAQVVMGIVASESLKEEKSSGTLTFAKFFSANPEATQFRQSLGISDAPTEAGDTKVSTSSLIRVMVDSLLLLGAPLEEDTHRQLTCESSTTLKYIMGKSIDTSTIDIDGDKAESLLSKFSRTNINIAEIEKYIKELKKLQNTPLCSFSNALNIKMYLPASIHDVEDSNTVVFLGKNLEEYTEKLGIATTADYIKYIDAYFIVCYVQNLICHLTKLFNKSKSMFCTCCMSVIKEIGVGVEIPCEFGYDFHINLHPSKNTENSRVLNEYFAKIFDLTKPNNLSVEENVAQLDRVYNAIEKYRRLL